jgi:hypothetical protein
MGRAKGKSTPKTVLDLPAKYFKRKPKPPTPEQEAELAEAVRKIFLELAEPASETVRISALLSDWERRQLDEMAALLTPKQLHAPGYEQRKIIPKLRDKYPPDGIPPEGTYICKVCEAIGEDPVSKNKTVGRTIKYLKAHAAKRLKG